jgi:glucosamine kinase
VRAIVHAQHALDGRGPNDDLAQALLAHVGAHDRDGLVVWLCEANQTAYASLARIVIAHRAHPFAARLLGEAGLQIGKMIAALDPSAALPITLCGGLGAPLREYVPHVYQSRLREPLADSAHGGLQLARREAARIAGER